MFRFSQKYFKTNNFYLNSQKSLTTKYVYYDKNVKLKQKIFFFNYILFFCIVDTQ